MTTLILAQKRFLSLPLTAGKIWLTDRFFEINKNGAVSLGAIAFTVAAALGYVFAMYATFEVGFFLQEQERAISELETSVTASETKANELRAYLAKDYIPMLNYMEKISDVKYIVKDGFAQSRPAIHP